MIQLTFTRRIIEPPKRIARGTTATIGMLFYLLMVLVFSRLCEILFFFSLLPYFCEIFSSRAGRETCSRQREPNMRGALTSHGFFEITSSEYCCQTFSETTMPSMTIPQRLIGSA
jgi:hypothetical protein